MWKTIAMPLVVFLLSYWYIPGDDKRHTIKGKRILITGASQGIGEELAYQYAKLGASTVITSRRQDVLDKVVKKCKSIGLPTSKHVAISTDMFDIDSISNLIGKAVKELGGLDIVVLNHVGKYKAAFFDGTKKNREYIYSTMDINFKSYVEVIGLVLPHLTKSEGNLIVLNSVAGVVPIPKMGPYSASKFALSGFVNSLRSQFIMEERNVSVMTCILGAIDTYNANQIWLEGNLTRIQKYLTPAPVVDTADAIVRASARREHFLYYPTEIGVAMTLYKYFTTLFDCGLREAYRY